MQPDLAVQNMARSGSEREHWRAEDYKWDRHSLSAEGASGSPNAGSEPRNRSASSNSSPQLQTSQGSDAPGTVPVVLDSLQQTGGAKKQIPLTCQVDGCDIDLGAAKEYYQRYRICPDHLKLGSLIKDGIPQRFCQQCGRFHILADFDGDKRSCRARLDLHNNRRRKRASGSGRGLSAGRARRAAAVAAAAAKGQDPDEVEASEARPVATARRSRSTRRRTLAQPDISEDEEMQSVEAVAVSRAAAAMPAQDMDVSPTYMKDFSPEVVEILQSLASPTAGPHSMPQHASHRPEGPAMRASQLQRASMMNGQASDNLTAQLMKAPSEVVNAEAYPYEDAMVRFLSEPANRRGLASMGSLNSTGSGALSMPSRGGYAPPATLDWSSRAGSLLNADSAALQEYFAKHAGQGNTSLAAARSLTSALSLAHGGNQPDLAEALYKCSSEPLRAQGQPREKAMPEGLADAAMPFAGYRQESLQQHQPWLGPMEEAPLLPGDTFAPSQPFLAQAHSLSSQHALRAASLQSAQGARSATWPSGSTTQQRTPAPDLFGDWDELSEPPLQFRSGPAADFWNARQEEPEGWGPGASQICPPERMARQQSLVSSPSLIPAESLALSRLPGIKEEGLGFPLPAPQAMVLPQASGQLLAAPRTSSGMLRQRPPMPVQMNYEASPGALVREQQLHSIGSGYQRLESARSRASLPMHVSGQQGMATHRSQGSLPGPMHDPMWGQDPHLNMLQRQSSHSQMSYAPEHLPYGHARAAERPEEQPPMAFMQSARTPFEHASGYLQSTPGQHAFVSRHQVPGEYQQATPPIFSPPPPLASSMKQASGPSEAPLPRRTVNVTFAEDLPHYTDETPETLISTGSLYDASASLPMDIGGDWHPLRVSTKMASVRPDELPGSLRQNFVNVLQSPWAEHTMQGMVRPGCLNLILEALEPGFPARRFDAAATAQKLMELNSGFWQSQLLVLQMPGSAVILDHGRITHRFTGQALIDFQPPEPEPKTLSHLTGSALIMPVPQGCASPATAGPHAGMPPQHVHLLGRFNGELVVDMEIPARRAHERLPLPLQNIKGSGLLWLEVDRDGILSPAVPVVISTNQDVVEEISDLEDDLALGNISTSQAEQLLLKIGSVLEFAEPFTQRMPAPEPAAAEPFSSSPSLPSADPATPTSTNSSPCTASTSQDAQDGEQWDKRLGSKEYTQAMVNCARALLAECCMRCWPALASKIVPLAAMGCKSFDQVVAASEEHCTGEAGGLLCAAVSGGSLSMAGLLLDLQDCTGYQWDLTQPQGGETPLHHAARLDDEGCMAGLLFARCSDATALWTTVTNSWGETPESIAQQLAARGRHWSYLAPAERASAEERLESHYNPAVLDTHGTDRTVSMAFSDRSALNSLPTLSPTPSLHYPRRDSGPLMSLTHSANVDQKLDMVAEASAPAELLSVPHSASSMASMPPISAASKRKTAQAMGKPRGRMVPAARKDDERAPLQTRLGSAPSALDGASRTDMKAAVQELMHSAMRQRPASRHSHDVAAHSGATSGAQALHSRRRSIEKLWSPFAAVSTVTQNEHDASTSAATAPAPAERSAGQQSSLLLPSLSAEHGHRSLLMHASSSRSLQSVQRSTSKALRPMDRVGSSSESGSDYLRERPSMQQHHSVRRSTMTHTLSPLQSETDEQCGSMDDRAGLSRDVAAAVKAVAADSDQQDAKPRPAATRWSSGFTAESSSSSGEWRTEELVPSGAALDMSWQPQLSHWATLSAPGRIPTSGTAADLEAASVLAGSDAELIRSASAAPQKQPKPHAMPASVAARSDMRPSRQPPSQRTARRRQAPESRDAVAMDSTEESADERPTQRRYSRHLPAYLVNPHAEMGGLQRVSMPGLGRSSVDIARQEAHASDSGSMPAHAWDIPRPAMAASATTAAAYCEPCSNVLQSAAGHAAIPTASVEVKDDSAPASAPVAPLRSEAPQSVETSSAKAQQVANHSLDMRPQLVSAAVAIGLALLLLYPVLPRTSTVWTFMTLLQSGRVLLFATLLAAACVLTRRPG